MSIIFSEKECQDITGYRSTLHVPDITMVDAQQFLIKAGYDIELYEGKIVANPKRSSVKNNIDFREVFMKEFKKKLLSL